MDTILDFLVDNYIWVLIISIFLIVVLIGYIADQKRKLKKIKQQNNQGVVNNNINVNTPVAEAVSSNTPPSVPVQETVNNTTNNVVAEPQSVEINTPVMETPIEEVAPVVENLVQEPIKEEPTSNLDNTPIVEEAPQTILDIPDNTTDIVTPVVEEVVSNPVENTQSDNLTTENNTIQDVESTPNVVNTWEPELVEENKDIINIEEEKDSI